MKKGILHIMTFARTSLYLTAFALAGCVPWYGGYHAVSATQGHVNGSCSGVGSPSTLTLHDDKVDFQVDGQNLSGTLWDSGEITFRLFVPQSDKVKIAWGQVNVTDGSTGESETVEASDVRYNQTIGFGSLPPPADILDGAIHPVWPVLNSDEKATVFTRTYRIKGKVPANLTLVVPDIRVNGVLHAGLRAHFGATRGFYCELAKP